MRGYYYISFREIECGVLNRMHLLGNKDQWFVSSEQDSIEFLELFCIGDQLSTSYKAPSCIDKPRSLD
jgi:hypothetical protein